ncbi:leukotriene A-4 hydrolase-like [Galleria mellonella]|uniref:Leukotriene A-4 hydrolase-like n=1 Tax=Galleria mellonella TaxID=7137 RepID=A0A6J1X1Z8_GALME|nr:leukotriene A-4 hydrolase-like [Galleria mellonella]
MNVNKCDFLTLSCFLTLLYIAQVRSSGALSPLDPSSFSKPDLAVMKHVSLVWNVDFDRKVLDGAAVLDFEILQDTGELILDVKNLTIEKIDLEDGTPLQHKIDDEVPKFGSKLTITLPKPVTTGDKLKIKIKYVTSPSASGLQWLKPSQTSGKIHPYLYSQAQPIHARSILPCQDTPAVKFTYDAEVRAPKEFTVLMSALRGEAKNNKTSFQQPVPIPAYLLALAVGVLEYRTVGPRSQVWSEKEDIERSAQEFAEVEKYLEAAEKLCGKYEWSQYDMLVLPPSFPHTGMENVRLTFFPHSVVAGDKSMLHNIIHEIMHSWTGNLVTNKNFEHFWLNEGFTVFLERKVSASLITDAEEAKRSRDFHSLLGLQDLTETIKDHLGVTNPLTRLVPDLNGVHPDDSFSQVPYEKGSLFLRYLEDLLGRPALFDDFLRSYIKKFQKQSIDTNQFKAYLLEYFKDNEKLKSVDWEAWLYGSGMPPVIPNYDTSMTKEVTELLSTINDANTTLNYNDVKKFTPHQFIYLLQQLIRQSPLPVEKLRVLGEEYKVSDSKNAEIAYRWLRLCIKSRDMTKLNDVFEFINQEGVMNYIRPIYRDLYAWEDVRERAIENFLKSEQDMFPGSAYTIRQDLHLI